MKLIDMLVDACLNRGFEWPDGFEYCAQEDMENMLVFCSEEMERTFWDGAFLWTSLTGGKYDEIIMFSELAEDYRTAQITKQEYLEALGRAKKEVVKEAEPEVSESNSVVKVDVVLKPKASIPDTLWHLPSMLSEYSRKKESFSLLENELNESRAELYKLQEDIRLLCEQQGWKIEPLGL